MVKQFRPRLSETEYFLLQKYREQNNNILIIPDLHAPFTLDGFLDFCKEVEIEYNCSRVVFIGDIIDNHYSSFHNSDPDLEGGGRELDKAIEIIKDYHDSFPNADVCLGNHDIIANRKAFAGGVSSRWVKDIGEVLNTPSWTYSEEYIIDGILFTHGTNRQARQRCLQEGISVAQGHYHSKSYVEYYQHREGLKFALQLGCGVDRESLAFAYGRNFAVQQINVGVIKNGVPIIIPYA